MDQDKSNLLETFGVKSTDDKEHDLAIEKELWDKLELNPEDAEAHKQYVGHVIRSGLLTEASRRYGKIIDDKEKHSIDTRRLSRYYQKQIVNLLFMAPSVEKPKKKNPTLGYLLAFLATMILFGGLLSLEFWYLILIGAAYLVPYIILKVRQFRNLSDKSRSNQPNISGY